MAVTGIDVEIVQLGENRQFIGKSLLEHPGHPFIKFLQELESSRALERMEVMGQFGTFVPRRALRLEEAPTGGRFVQRPLEAQRDPSRVGELGANSLRGTR
jgi:hypothetical protein